NWKQAANLDGVLIGSEGAELEFTKIGWDNLDSLREEAEECGLVVDPGDSSSHDGKHEDCDISNDKTIAAYRANPSVNPCEDVMDLNLDTLDTKLENFNPTAYATVPQGRVIRRVIYLKGRTQ